MGVIHVPGTSSRQIMLYALSTCGWCHKTRKLLDELGVEYDYVYVDQLDDDEKEHTVRTVKAWNPACSFPTIVLDDKSCLIGYDEAQIRKELKK